MEKNTEFLSSSISELIKKSLNDLCVGQTRNRLHNSKSITNILKKDLREMISKLQHNVIDLLYTKKLYVK